MKPDWKDAPDWARWLAQDSNGAWYWYQNKPHYADTFAGFMNCFEDKSQHAYINPDWQSTLEKRPKAQ